MTRDEVQLIDMLKAAVGDDEAALLGGPDIPVKHWTDWTRLPSVKPLALARPRTTRQVSELLRICNATSTPVVPQGGLTGLVGGAHPIEGCVAISLERMAGVEEIDVAAATLTVLAGTPLAVVQAAAEAAGLILPLDIGARGSCTIGGNLATNAGGNRVISYGPARDHVLGLEAVLPDGSVLQAMNKLVKNNTGYDLKHLFIGSEGTLGIITRVVLRLRPRPATQVTALCACPTPGDLVAALATLRKRLGPSLSAFEAMWPDFWKVATSRMGHRSPFDQSHGAYALVEMSGFDADRDEDRLQSALSEGLESGVLSDAVVAQSGQQAAEFWAIRESVGELRSFLGPITSFDVGMPAKHADAFIVAVADGLRAQWPDVIHLCYGHLGDNNIHVVVHIPSSHERQPKNAINDLVYAVVARYGGCVSAEHGIGLTKRAYLHLSRSPQEIATMRTIKAAIDPNGIMNPGKVLDSQAR